MELGISAYEARAYLALLQTHPATAYEIARQAEIPTSKVYQVMEKLLRRGLAQPLANEDKKQYIPQDPREFLAGQKSQLANTFAALEQDFASFQPRVDISYLWNLRDYAGLIEKAGQLIRQAQSSLLLSVWREELEQVLPVLRQAADRNLQIAIVHYGPTDIQIGQLYIHPIERTIYAEKAGRGITLVSDAGSALVGTVSEQLGVEGAWSVNQGFVTLAEDYIKHDIYIMKIVKRFDTELIRRFGDGYHKLRDIFTDEEVKDANLY